MSIRQLPIALITILMSLCFRSYSMGAQLSTVSTSDGLSDLLVNTIYKDSTGYVWFGTETALDRFDGNQVKTFSFPEEAGGSRRVNAITELRKGEIFVGNSQGLYMKAPFSYTLEKVRPDKIACGVNALADDGRQIVWIGTTQGVFRYDVSRNKLRQILLRRDIMAQENDVSGLWPDSSGGVWASSLHSLYHIGPDFSVKEFPSPEKGVMTQMAQARGRIYLGTRGDGIVPFDTVTERFLPPVVLGNGIITSLMSDGGDKLWASTDGDGIYGYSISGVRVTDRFNTSPQSPMKLASNSVYSMFTDKSGLYWIGYYQNGAAYTPRHNDLFEVYSWPGLIDTRNHAVRAVAVNGSQKVIGTREGLFFVDEASGRTAVFSRPELRSNLVFAITEDKGRYYIGTYNGGMYILDPRTLSLTPANGKNEILRDATVFCIVPWGDDSLLVGTDKGMFVFRDGEEENRYTVANSKLPHNSVYEIFIDSKGRGWICTETGMAIWDGKTLQTDRFPNGFINDTKIRDICEGRDGTLYFAPDRGEVFRSNLELTEYGPISYASEGDNMMTTFIVEDPDGWIWFGTDNGLTRYDKRSHFHLFNNADGIPNVVFTLCQPVRDDEGNIWFGNSNGLLRLDFNKFKKNKGVIHDALSVTDVKSNGRSIIDRLKINGRRRSIELDAKENDLSVSFSNFGFIPSRYQVIEYQLDGYDSGWHKIDGSHDIHYFDLSAGEYLLRLRLHGDPDTERVVHVYKNRGLDWPMITVCIAALLVIVFLYFLNRARLRHRKELVVLEERAAESNSQSSVSSPEAPAKPRYRTTSLSEEECKRLVRILDRLMKNDRPYTNPDLKIADLASMAGTTAHALSFLFNQYMKKSYYDYVNEYRVGEFRRLVADGAGERYTLSAMAAKCGFSSRASFFRHFKNSVGVTPAEYLKRSE